MGRVHPRGAGFATAAAYHHYAPFAENYHNSTENRHHHYNHPANHYHSSEYNHNTAAWFQHQRRKWQASSTWARRHHTASRLHLADDYAIAGRNQHNDKGDHCCTATNECKPSLWLPGVLAGRWSVQPAVQH
mmetsp:Transcript_18571/g.46483  ORF Transcript_18571/g.46483 Transcript_18571/m.46483 type:complete len:132 (+) Transcript_18571:714-1109(+)